MSSTLANINENRPTTNVETKGGTLAKTKKKLKTKNSASDSRLNTSSNVIESSFNAENQHLPDNFHGNEEIELKYGAAHVINLFVPVSLCMAVVILTMSTIGYYSQDDGVYLIYTPFTKKTDNAGELFVMSIGNALTMLSVVIVMSMVLIFLYKFRFYRVIHGWLMFSSIILLSVFTTLYLSELFNNYNMAVDYITFGFFVWNYICLGMICIHWKGPLILQQFYLIVMSALMALIFIKFLPEWTVWTVLAVLSIWDLVAVLCPNGPLRILVETAQERNEPIFPALIYSSGVLYIYFVLTQPDTSTQLLTTTNEEEEDSETTMTNRSARALDTVANVPSAGDRFRVENEASTSSAVRYAPLRKNTNETTNATNNNNTARPNSGNEAQPSSGARQLFSSHRRSHSTNIPPQYGVEVEERGVKLGLGDFIFYSVLVGKASSFGDWNTTVACYIAILVGLAFTLMLLALFRKALPALPISIFIGIIFFFATRGLMSPFISELSLRRYVI